MKARQKEWTNDWEILSLNGGILDGLATFEQPIDWEVADLRGGILDGLPATILPLSTFRLEAGMEPAPISRPRIDSIAPVAMGETQRPPPPAIALAGLAPEPTRGWARRWAPQLLGVAVAAGLAGFFTARTMGPVTAGLH